jgi:S-(hydroxymethyl)glutathione dehydrogenase/alcohol dehydrogenase
MTACFAERTVVAAAGAVPLDAEIPLWQAALLGCGVVTGAGAVRNTAGVRLGDSVAVIGCGGVGLQVVAAAGLAGAGRVVAVDRDPAKLELALARGATDAVDVSDEENMVKRIRAAAGGALDWAFEVIGRASTMRLAWDVLRPGGTAIVVGLAPVGVEVSLPAIEFLSEKSIKGCFYGSTDVADELPRLARLVASGRLPLADVISRVTGLDWVDDALERLRRGEGARTVIVMDRELAQAPELVA